MQNQNTFLNREKTQAILDSRPQGISVEEALSALSKKGLTIEGYNDKSTAQKIGEGAVDLGKGIVKDALGTLLVRPAVRTTEAVTRSLFPDSMAAKGYEAMADEGQAQNVMGIEVPQVQSGADGLKQVAGEAAQSATYLAPYGKIAGGVAGATGSKVASQVTAGLTGGYLVDLGKNLPDNNQTLAQAVTPGVNTLIGGAIGASPVLLEGAGKITKKVGEKVTGAVTPIDTQEARIMQTYQANNNFAKRFVDLFKDDANVPRSTAKTILEKNLLGSKSMIGTGAERVQKKLWNKLIQPALDNSNKAVDLPKYFDTVEAQIVSTTDDITRQKALIEALDAIRTDYAGKQTVSLAQLQKIKEGWAEFVPEKFYKGQNIAGNVRQVQALLADEARQTIYNTLGDNVKKAYFDYGNLIGLKELGIVSKTGQKLKGGTGGYISEVLSQAVTPFGTIAGQTIYKTGQLIEFIGKAGQKTLGGVLELDKKIKK